MFPTACFPPLSLRKAAGPAPLLHTTTLSPSSHALAWCSMMPGWVKKTYATRLRVSKADPFIFLALPQPLA